MSQTEIVRDILERDGQIDNFTCIHEHISLRLGARVHELREQGYNITTTKQNKNTIYRLVAKPGQQLALV